MKKSIITCTTLMCCVSFCSAANILAIFITASPSHHIWTSPLAIALANRGHNVTAIGPDGPKTPVPNLSYIVMKTIYEDVKEGYTFEDMSEMSPWDWINEIYNYFRVQCTLVLKTDAFKQLMDNIPETKYDLIIIESIGTECFLSALTKFGSPPIVAVSAYSVPIWAFEQTGTPSTPSHIPNNLLSYSHHMTFAERIENFITRNYVQFNYHYNYLPSMDRIAAEHFGSHLRPAHEVLQNISITIANFHPTLDYPWPMSPSLIPAAGINIRDPKPLPNDLQTFLDNANEGAIFFSLGSNLRSDKLQPEKRKAILDAFAELPQKVLWKFESDLPDLPKNVKVGKWLPQSDILAHPNVKLFITHSGLLSTHETVHRGVPVVGIPFLADQHINIRRMINHGCGVLLEYRDLTKETLLKAVRKVITEPSYSENMKTLSERFRDEPQKPLEKAVFWTEYVLRHKGAPHLVSAAKDMNFIQYHLLDVIAFLLLTPPLILFVLYFVLCRKHSKKVSEKKQN